MLVHLSSMGDEELGRRSLENFKAFIAERGMTHERVALRAGMSIGTFNKYIRGARKLPLWAIGRLARALQRNPEDFLAEHPPAPRPMRPVAFAVAVVDEDVNDELYQRASRALDPFNEEYAQTRPKEPVSEPKIQEDSNDPSLAGRVHTTDEASVLLASKAATKSPQQLEQKKQPRRSSKRGASKRARPR